MTAEQIMVSNTNTGYCKHYGANGI